MIKISAGHSNRLHPAVSLAIGSIFMLACVSVLPVARVHAQSETIPTATVSLQEPNGQNDKVAEAPDFATTVLGDPWDMNDPTDLLPTGPANNPGHGFRNVVFHDGIFEGVTLSNDSALWLHHQGMPLANNIDLHNGLAHPIDAARFFVLTFRLYRDDGDRNVPIRIYWYKAGDEVSGQPSGMSAPIIPQAGWNTYTLNLSNPANVATGSWSGPVTGLRIDPTSTNNTSFRDKVIKVDWVRLTDMAPVTVNVQWQDNISTDGQAVMSLFIDDDNVLANGIIKPMGQTVAAAGAGSFPVNTRGLPPGSYYVHGIMGIDYAGLVRRDPWNFMESSDYVRLDNFGNVTVADGRFRGRSTTNDPQIWMNIPAGQPVDTSIYRYLAVRLYVSSPPNTYPFINFLWTRQGDSGPWQNSSQFVLMQEGWNLIQVDLAAFTQSGAWSGLVTDLRVDPVTNANVDIQLDWVALLATNHTPAAEAELTPAMATSRGPLTINQAPIVRITAPSMASGADYATTVLGRPWDFRTADSVERLVEITDAAYTANGLVARTSGTAHAGCPGDCGDAQVWLKVSPDPAKYIDAERFKYVTVRYRQEGEQDVYHGWATRFLWTPNVFPTDQSTLDDVIPRDGWPGYGANDGWYTYQYDLTKMGLEIDGYVPGRNNWGWNNTRGKIARFRFDPTEMAAATNFQLDKVLLTADPVSTGATIIQWTLRNPDDNATINLYAVDVARSGDRLHIGSVQQPAESFVWDTTGVAQGKYLIVLELNDGFNTTAWTSQVPLVVTQPLSIAVTEPDGLADRLVRAPDFATDVLSNAWDMDASTDLDMRIVNQVTSPTFNQGIMAMTSTGPDSHFWLNWDNARPIDANVYRNLCVRMNLSQSSQGEVYWYDQGEQAHSSGHFLTLPGWQHYQIALHGNAAWSGSVKRLRFDPVFASNIQIEIDSIKLTNPAQAGYTVRWAAGGSSDAKVAIFYNTTGSTQDGVLLASDLPATQGMAVIDTSCLEPGDYYIVVQIDDGVSPPQRSVSPGRLTILRNAQGASVTPGAVILMVQRGGAPAVQQLAIDANGLPEAWQVTATQATSWLRLSQVSGVGYPATLTLTAAPGPAVPLGAYTLTLELSVEGVTYATVPVRVLVVDQVFSGYLPLVRRN